MNSSPNNTVLLTAEQEAIIQSVGNLKINAVAGSGKTTTVIEYARSRPAGSKILYLAFNKTVRLEAARRFAEKGLRNVQVETAHSLAFKHVVVGKGYTIRANGYKTHELVECLQLQSTGEKHTEYIVANHIARYAAYFCNSDKEKVQQLYYPDVVTDEKAKAFVQLFYTYIQDGTRRFSAKMNDGSIEITHDFYLKKFQLQKPVLHYDYILFDEGQDASPAMLDVFLSQQATKVIVGDTHQQIYGWRFAVNSLEKADYQNYYLSTSFRFGGAIAALASAVLGWKGYTAEHLPVVINGQASVAAGNTKATIARTNLGLLLKAIEFVTEHKDVAHIYFEGNIHSYTYADDGASLYDVLNLYNSQRQSIRDPVIKGMRDMAELEDYIEKTEDQQLQMMVEIVKKYGNQIPAIIKQLKQKHVGDEERHKAEMIFSTVHRCKGMEYDAVQLVDDFVTEAKLEKAAEDIKAGKPPASLRYHEEINLLYVAITRTKSKLHIPEKLMPKAFPAHPEIEVLKPKPDIDESENKIPYSTSRPYRSFEDSQLEKLQRVKNKWQSVEEKRKVHSRAYEPWTKELDKELYNMMNADLSVSEMAQHFNRNNNAIASRIKKLKAAAYDADGLNEHE